MADAAIPNYERKRTAIERAALRRAELTIAEAHSAVKKQISDFFNAYAVDGFIPPEQLNKYNRIQKLEEALSKDVQKTVLTFQRGLKGSVASASMEAYTLMAYGISKTIDTSLRWSYSQARAVEAIQNFEFSAFNKNSRTFRNLSSTMREGVRQRVVSGLLNRRSYSEITRDVTTYMRSTSRGLRPMVARVVRTEVGRALEVGNQLCYDDANAMGLIVKKRWLATKDDRVRDTHLALDGQLEDEDGLFWSGNAFAKHPHDFGVASQDCGCRCSTIASIDDSTPQKRYVRGEGVGPYSSFSVENT